jgi:hypothetical protein
VDELGSAHSVQQAAAAEQRERADALQTQLAAALADATAAVERASESEAAMRDKVQRLDRLEGGSVICFTPLCHQFSKHVRTEVGAWRQLLHLFACGSPTTPWSKRRQFASFGCAVPAELQAGQRAGDAGSTAVTLSRHCQGVQLVCQASLMWQVPAPAAELGAFQDVIGDGDQGEMLSRLVSRVAALELAITEAEARRRDAHNQLIRLRGNVRGDAISRPVAETPSLLLWDTSFGDHRCDCATAHLAMHWNLCLLASDPLEHGLTSAPGCLPQIRVFCRLRPAASSSAACSADGVSLALTADDGKRHSFAFDKVGLLTRSSADNLQQTGPTVITYKFSSAP